MLNRLYFSIICLILLNVVYSIDGPLGIIKPKDIIDVKTVLPRIQLDVRYYGAHNFIGRKIAGYDSQKCLLTESTVFALKKVEDKLLANGLTLKIYDCYRPQMAVDDFVNWAFDTSDTKMKSEFYPNVDKKNLFKYGYIAVKSAHSRGSTLDLTIVPVNSSVTVYNTQTKLLACTNSVDKRVSDNSLDFGSGFDCFDPISHSNYLNIKPSARANRLLLKTLMEDAGFIGIKEEWWHFTLRNEPYPQTYFNFPIK